METPMVDYLRDYPFEPAPDTWPLNDVFIKIIGEKEKLWKEHGFVWTLGVEREIYLFSPDRLHDFLMENYKTTDEGQLLVMDPHLAVSFNMQHSLQEDDFYKDAYVQLERQCEEKINERLARAHTPEEKQQANNERYIFKAIKESWRYSEKSRREMVLTKLHLFTQEEGGIADLVEYRFGQAQYGAGWYDCGDIVEFRTPKADGMINAIETYHRMMWKIKEACESYGLIPVLTGGPVDPHIHFSFKINNTQDGHNLTTFDAPGDINFMVGALQGYFELLEKTPSLTTDVLPDELVRDQLLKIHPTRMANLRICDDNLEVRMDIAHLARNMAILIAGSSVYAFEQDDSVEKPSITMEKYILVSATHMTHYTGLTSALVNCRVDMDGHLIADPETMSRMMGRILQEIDFDPASISMGEGEEAVTLEHWNGWAEAFKKIRYTDGALDLSGLPEALQKLFAQYKNVSTIPRPHYRRDREDMKLVSEDFEGGGKDQILQRAFGNAHGEAIAEFYKADDLEKRTINALENLTSLLEDADDPDKPLPDIMEKIYVEMMRSLQDSLESARGKLILISMQALQDLTRQRLSTMADVARKIYLEESSNSRRSMLMDFTNEAGKPFEELSRFSGMMMNSLYNIFKQTVATGRAEEAIQYVNLLAETLMMPCHFFALLTREEDRDAMLDAFGKTMAQTFDDSIMKLEGRPRELWLTCRDLMLDNIVRLKQGPDENDNVRSFCNGVWKPGQSPM